MEPKKEISLTLNSLAVTAWTHAKKTDPITSIMVKRERGRRSVGPDDGDTDPCTEQKLELQYHSVVLEFGGSARVVSVCTVRTRKTTEIRDTSSNARPKFGILLSYRTL